jgi:hypothetical protein
MALAKIISGGQTGVDRGALDAALVAGFPCGGWCLADREAEDGPIPERYPLTPLPAEFTAGNRQRAPARQVGEQYRARTLKNVQDSDGTAILFDEWLTGGTLVTRHLCVRAIKPFVVLDAKQMTKLRVADAVSRFVEEYEIQVLNVTGPRLSGWPQGYRFALAVVSEVLAREGR